MTPIQPPDSPPRWPRQLLDAVLARSRRPVTVALLAVVLTLPALRVGFIADDFYHRAALLGSRAFREFVHGPLDMFRFFDGDPARTMRMMDRGILPWWTYPEIKGAFWRPLTVLTHWLDYRLWPDSAALMHLHSILWYGGLAAVAALLYRRLMPSPWLAALAALLYAVDHTHGTTVGFLANRNALISTLFGVFTLLAHDRWRRDGWRYGALLAPVTLLLSLLAKEEGVATCAYLLAYALFLDGRGSGQLRFRAQRFLALLPYATVVLGWRAAWAYLGYGVANVGFYVDPLREPLRFAAAVFERAPFLLLGQWALPPSEISILRGLVHPAIIGSTWCAAVVFVGILAAATIPVLRRDRLARFWALGMILSILPMCAAFPADRLLCFAGLGAMGLLAQFLDGIFHRQPWRPPGRTWLRGATALAYALAAIHLVLAPIALPLRTAYPAGPKPLEQFDIRVPPDPAIAGQDLIVINPPSTLHAAYFTVQQEFRGGPLPRHVRLLASGLGSVTIRRVDAQTLIVRPANGFMAWSFEKLLRDERHPMSLGDRVELTGVTVEVTALTDDRRPAEALFRFAVPLGDPSLRWLRWRDGGFEPFMPPGVGESVDLAPVSFGF